MQTLRSLIQEWQGWEHRGDLDLPLAVEISFEKQLGRLYLDITDGSDSDLAEIAGSLSKRVYRSPIYLNKDSRVNPD